MKPFLATFLITAALAAPVSVSAAATGMHWNLSKPVIATCKDGTILNTTGRVRGGLLSVWELNRRTVCAFGK